MSNPFRSRKSWITLGAGVAVLGLLWVVGSSESFAKCVYDAQSAHHGQTAPQHLSVLGVQLVPSFHCTGVFLREDEPVIVALATVGLFLVTGFLALYTYRLWSVTSENAQRQLRAYLGVFVVSIRRDVVPNGTVIIKNTGQTPARNVTAWIDAGVNPSATHPDISQAQPKPEGSKTSIGSQDTMTLLADRIEPVLSGQTTWLFGAVQYRDVFGQPHSTKFCMSRPEGMPLPLGVTRACEVAGHNDAD